MKTEYLFMAGEYKVSMPLAFKRDNWSHTMSQTRLELVREEWHWELLYRKEPLRGVIHYANCQDSELERKNLLDIKQSGVSCWPNPDRLLLMLDRHKVMQACIDADFVSSSKVRVCSAYQALITDPVAYGPGVVKIGNQHRGIGKYSLLDDEWYNNCLPDDLVTLEPFYEGESIRVLLLDDRVFGIRITNDSNWIKNASGAEAHVFDLNIHPLLILHARKVQEYFGLDVAGVDYILKKDGSFHFLEINQYPGLATTEEVEEYAKVFLSEKMDEVEND